MDCQGSFELPTESGAHHDQAIKRHKDHENRAIWYWNPRKASMGASIALARSQPSWRHNKRVALASEDVAGHHVGHAATDAVDSGQIVGVGPAPHLPSALMAHKYAIARSKMPLRLRYSPTAAMAGMQTPPSHGHGPPHVQAGHDITWTIRFVGTREAGRSRQTSRDRLWP